MVVGGGGLARRCLVLLEAERVGLEVGRALDQGLY